MKKIVLAVMLLVGCVSGSNASLIDITKVNGQYQANIVLVPPAVVKKVTVGNGSNSTEAYYRSDLDTTVFFLIDASLPMKRAFQKGIRPLLLDMEKAKEPKDHWIVAYFDKDMHIVYDDSKNSIDELDGILKQIPIKGKRTELWRNTQDAIRELSSSGSERKILVLMSDGDAEDTSAYTREGAIDMANKANIRILSIAYRDTLGTQNLRKISEETGGVFFRADKRTEKLPDSFFRDFKIFVRSEGEIIIPPSLIHPTQSGKEDLNITVEHSGGSDILNVTVDTARIVPPQPKAQSGAKVQQKPVQSQKNALQRFIERYKIYIGIGAAVLLLLILLLLIFRKKERPEDMDPDEQTVTGAPAEAQNRIDESADKESTVLMPSQPLAYFKSVEGDRFDVYRLPAGIGKSKTNDIIIDRKYVSRKHAVLTYKGGHFYIADDNSSNGVYVNGRKIQVPTRIEGGARVGFGPYEVIFTVLTGGTDTGSPNSEDMEKTRLNR